MRWKPWKRCSTRINMIFRLRNWLSNVFAGLLSLTFIFSTGCIPVELKTAHEIEAVAMKTYQEDMEALATAALKDLEAAWVFTANKIFEYEIKLLEAEDGTVPADEVERLSKVRDSVLEATREKLESHYGKVAQARANYIIAERIHIAIYQWLSLPGLFQRNPTPMLEQVIKLREELKDVE